MTFTVLLLEAISKVGGLHPLRCSLPATILPGRLRLGVGWTQESFLGPISASPTAQPQAPRSQDTCGPQPFAQAGL